MLDRQPLEKVKRGAKTAASVRLAAGDMLTFVQLSDPHLTSLDEVRLGDLLNKRLLGYLSWRHKRRKEHSGEVLAALRSDLLALGPEHLVVTGDLTHIGLPEEFHQARQWLESLGQGDRVTVIPGNHDAYARHRWDSRFTAWRPFMTSDADSRFPQQRAGADPFPLLRVRGPVAFIGLSSAGPSAPFFATGSLGEQQLQRLAELLQTTGRQGLFRVLLLHHPPRPGDEKWRKRLTDASGLCVVLGEQRAELVLHGHTHRAVRSEIEGIPVFGVPSASTLRHQPEHRAGYNVYKVARDRQSWRLDVSIRRYQPDKKGFFHEHDQHLRVPLARMGGEPRIK